ncbi:MAG: hypothetical protein LBJ32_02005, partial [Oscillospiraceae bacterium]|nr:hypothetical protein [Oscillospiraceae bacterium]
MKINRFIKFLKAINPFIKIPADKNYIKSDSINNGLSKIKSKLIAAALAILAAIPSSNTFAIKKDSSMAQDAKSKKDNSNNQKLKILASF